MRCMMLGQRTILLLLVFCLPYSGLRMETEEGMFTNGYAVLLWLKQRASEGGKHRKWIFRKWLHTLLEHGDRRAQELVQETGESV